jgi:hypothetical protein
MKNKNYFKLASAAVMKGADREGRIVRKAECRKIRRTLNRVAKASNED